VRGLKVGKGNHLLKKKKKERTAPEGLNWGQTVEAAAGGREGANCISPPGYPKNDTKRSKSLATRKRGKT